MLHEQYARVICLQALSVLPDSVASQSDFQSLLPFSSSIRLDGLRPRPPDSTSLYPRTFVVSFLHDCVLRGIRKCVSSNSRDTIRKNEKRTKQATGEEDREERLRSFARSAWPCESTSQNSLLPPGLRFGGGRGDTGPRPRVC